MNDNIPLSPTEWSVVGNLIPDEISNPASVNIYTKMECTLEIEPAVVVDGKLLNPIKSTPSF